MAETLTVDTTPDSEVLTADEQDSLQVGEKMAEAEQQLLAGKYENAEQLEKAYIELQKKLGEGGEEPEASTETEEESEETESEESELSAGASLIGEASSEWAENGELTPETMAKFSQMSSQDLVNAYIEMQANAPEQLATQEAAPPDLSDAEVNTIKNSVGGEKAYEQVIQWAGQNLTQTQIDAFDSIISNGNAEAIQLVVDGLKSQYDSANGYEGRMLTGKGASAAPTDGFRSQAELVAAMADPRYDNDPAYRNDVLTKLDRSDLNF
jgi:hypothetical protein